MLTSQLTFRSDQTRSRMAKANYGADVSPDSRNRDEFDAHYHRRSNVESVFSTMKRKFGEKLRRKGETAQINEALCKVLAHNLCCLCQSFYELGIDPTFASESSVDANVFQ